MQNYEFPSLRSSCNDLLSSVVEPPSYAAKLNRSCQELPIKVNSSEFVISAEDFPELSRSRSSKKKNKNCRRNENLIEKKTTRFSETFTKVPLNMIKDHYGIAGLLSFIRQSEQDQDKTILAPGVELTTMGLDMNSTDLVHRNMLSPFTSSTNCLHRIDAEVPEEYHINEFINEHLSLIDVVRYGVDVLFFQFYLQPGDVIQTIAAYELYRRGWRYLINSQLWIARLPGTEPYQRTPLREQGRYYVFDPQIWERKIRDLVVDYENIDKKPIIYEDFLNIPYYVPVVKRDVI
ncbi:DgyrCDS350 [Dimorphilus gyrociliatus]|uniref:DgyrCDS350 n=1 Tax=Dimorphilus gyrociliatus TaxID=2664684 RepID=A0A7I8V6V2_9ANNE|nr:DgyrCDS350 [Dimorphilus gyrociliatus]